MCICTTLSMKQRYFEAAQCGAHKHVVQYKLFPFCCACKKAEQITPYLSGTNRLPGCGWSSLCCDSDVWQAAICARYSNRKVTTRVGDALYNA